MAKRGLIARLFNLDQSSRKQKVLVKLPVFNEKRARQVTTPSEIKKSRIYANVPLGME